MTATHANRAEAMAAFVSAYEAMFGPFPAEPGTPEASYWWQRLVSDLPLDMFTPVLDKTRLVHGPFGKPHLADCLEAWKLVRTETATAPQAPWLARRCQACDGMGLFRYPAVVGTDGRYWFGISHGALHWYSFPCRCTAGQAEKQRFRYDEVATEESRERYFGLLEECGCSDDPVVMTKEEFRRLSPKPTPLSEMWSMITASRELAEPKEEPCEKKVEVKEDIEEEVW